MREIVTIQTLVARVGLKNWVNHKKQSNRGLQVTSQTVNKDWSTSTSEYRIKISNPHKTINNKSTSLKMDRFLNSGQTNQQWVLTT